MRTIGLWSLAGSILCHVVIIATHGRNHILIDALWLSCVIGQVVAFFGLILQILRLRALPQERSTYVVMIAIGLYVIILFGAPLLFG